MPPLAPTARTGFTLMEVVVAMSVLTLSIAGAAFMLTSAYGAYRHQDRTLARDQLIHNRVETLTATPYSQFRQAIRQARRPGDPPRDGVAPPEDFTTLGGGEVEARYDLAPPQGDEKDWKPLPPPKPGAGPDIAGATSPDRLRATLRLQYWDPQFDAPAATDRGLIRATLTLEGDRYEQRAVKYVTR